MASTRTCILVLGMHRSGTSALTRVISLLGAALPQNLMLAAQNNNEAGFWEPRYLWTLHDQMLGEAGSRWDDWRKLDLSALPPDRLRHYKAELGRQIAEEYGDAQLIVLKEPRICRFAPFFIGLLAELGYECHCLLALRNPLAVIASLSRRDSMSEGFAALLWLRYVLDADAATRSMPRAIVSYDVLLADWQSKIQILSTRLGIEWPRAVGEVRGETEKFLSNELRHFAPSLRDLQARGDISAWVRDSYAALLRVELNPDDMPAYSVLDRVRDEFEVASQAFGTAIFSELAERERKFEVERGRLAEVRDGEIAEHEALARAHNDLIAQRDALVRVRDGEIAEHEALARAHNDLIVEREALARAHNDLIVERDALARSSRDLIVERDALIHDRDSVTGERNALLASRSWRITAPLRKTKNNGSDLINGIRSRILGFVRSKVP